MDKYLIALDKCIKLGPRNFQKLFSFFENSKEAWEGTFFEFGEAGLSKELAQELSEHIKNTNPEKEIEELERLKVKTISSYEADYPLRLKEIHTPPRLLYYYGNLRSEETAVAIVGSRKATSYGAQVTKDIATELAQSGVTVVSGLALGIDTIAHKAAVSEGKRTIAVLGCGLDKIYPASNYQLAREILQNGGAIISEYALGVPPLKQNFPARNRIISGLSQGVVITEAAEGSGSLITAKDALEQGREVFAVPGNIYNRNSIGPNNLIKLGAKTVTKAEDILEELNINFVQQREKAKKIYPSTKEEALILDILNEPKHIDEIIKTTGIEAHTASSTLTLMEIKGKVKHLGGMIYAANF